MVLVLGVLLWSVAHLFVSLAMPTRARIVARIGLNPYKGLFSLTIVLALVLMVLGWQALPPNALWTPPPGLRHLTMLLMPFAVILFFAARLPTDLKRLIRHPQLTGVKLWALAHLLSNGELRSVILFAGLLAWAVAEVIVLNRRAGAWVKPAPVGMGKTVLEVLIGLALTAALMFGHPWFTGVPLLPRG